MFPKLILSLLLGFFLISSQAAFAGYDDFTVNIPNSEGGFTSIVIKKSGDGYTGPQGEFYSSFPSVAQLVAMYGASNDYAKIAAPEPAPAFNYAEPVPNVQTVTYVEPQPQPVVYTDPGDQVQYVDQSPVYYPSPDQEWHGAGHQDDYQNVNVITYFNFKKKKQSPQGNQGQGNQAQGSQAQGNSQNTQHSNNANTPQGNASQPDHHHHDGQGNPNEQSNQVNAAR